MTSILNNIPEIVQSPFQVPKVKPALPSKADMLSKNSGINLAKGAQKCPVVRECANIIEGVA